MAFTREEQAAIQSHWQRLRGGGQPNPDAVRRELVGDEFSRPRYPSQEAGLASLPSRAGAPSSGGFIQIRGELAREPELLRQVMMQNLERQIRQGDEYSGAAWQARNWLRTAKEVPPSLTFHKRAGGRAEFTPPDEQPPLWVKTWI